MNDIVEMKEANTFKNTAGNLIKPSTSYLVEEVSLAFESALL